MANITKWTGQEFKATLVTANDAHFSNVSWSIVNGSDINATIASQTGNTGKGPHTIVTKLPNLTAGSKSAIITVSGTVKYFDTDDSTQVTGAAPSNVTCEVYQAQRLSTKLGDNNELVKNASDTSAELWVGGHVEVAYGFIQTPYKTAVILPNLSISGISSGTLGAVAPYKPGGTDSTYNPTSVMFSAVRSGSGSFSFEPGDESPTDSNHSSATFSVTVRQQATNIELYSNSAFTGNTVTSLSVISGGSITVYPKLLAVNSQYTNNDASNDIYIKTVDVSQSVTGSAKATLPTSAVSVANALTISNIITNNTITIAASDGQGASTTLLLTVNNISITGRTIVNPGDYVQITVNGGGNINGTVTVNTVAGVSVSTATISMNGGTTYIKTTANTPTGDDIITVTVTPNGGTAVTHKISVKSASITLS